MEVEINHIWLFKEFQNLRRFLHKQYILLFIVKTMELFS